MASWPLSFLDTGLPQRKVERSDPQWSRVRALQVAPLVEGAPARAVASPLPMRGAGCPPSFLRSVERALQFERRFMASSCEVASVSPHPFQRVARGNRHVPWWERLPDDFHLQPDPAVVDAWHWPRVQG